MKDFFRSLGMVLVVAAAAACATPEPFHRDSSQWYEVMRRGG